MIAKRVGAGVTVSSFPEGTSNSSVGGRKVSTPGAAEEVERCMNTGCDKVSARSAHQPVSTDEETPTDE
jgi:hypothetical protein